MMMRLELSKKPRRRWSRGVEEGLGASSGSLRSEHAGASARVRQRPPRSREKIAVKLHTLLHRGGRALCTVVPSEAVRFDLGRRPPQFGAEAERTPSRLLCCICTLTVDIRSAAPVLRGQSISDLQLHLLRTCFTAAQLQSFRAAPPASGALRSSRFPADLITTSASRYPNVPIRATCQRREVRTREGLGQLRFGLGSARLLMLVHTLTRPACLCLLRRRQSPDAAKAFGGIFHSAGPRVPFTRRASMTPAFASLRPNLRNLCRSCGQTTNNELRMSSSSAST